MSLQLFPEEPLASIRVESGQPFYRFLGEINTDEFQLLYRIATKCKQNTGSESIDIPLKKGSQDPVLKNVAALSVRLIQLEKGSQVCWFPLIFKTVITKSTLSLYLTAEIRDYLHSLKLDRFPVDRLDEISGKLSMQVLLVLLSIDAEISIPVDAFRRQLQLTDHYQRWTDFTNKVLKPLQQSLKGSSLEFTFFTIRKGNTPVSILFRLTAGLHS